MGHTPRPDALDLLTADQTQAGWLFATFKAVCERGASVAEKSAVAEEICRILSIQAQLEEEIFYPAVRPGIEAPGLMDQAEFELFAVKDLIAEVCALPASDPLYDGKMASLQVAIQRRGRMEQTEIFPRVREADIDLATLAVEIQNRKSELLAQGSDIHDRLQREDESADPVGPSPSQLSQEEAVGTRHDRSEVYAMTQPDTTTPPKKLPKLEEQGADFTAEGAPPPGKVGTTAPVLPDKVPVSEADDPGPARKARPAPKR